ncbi:hypothetical protein TIFTF001_025007 [Ficus carica]|uniref:Uncharacterized protein n=1 Tax=Ficus carica TaxID=3494 RepID=A0AA88AHZ4_FICCA|nr:hypothetical protein TIFTF001_025007 [Ficus carica]
MIQWTKRLQRRRRHRPRLTSTRPTGTMPPLERRRRPALSTRPATPPADTRTTRPPGPAALTVEVLARKDLLGF